RGPGRGADGRPTGGAARSGPAGRRWARGADVTGRSVPPGAVGRADHGLDGPYGDDLVIGTPLPSAPPITIDAGVAAAYQTIVGDPLRLALSDPVSRQVTGRTQRLVNPALVLHMAIGQSTVATRLVIANLFYRDVVLRRQLHVGDTVTTLVTPVARALTRPGPAGRQIGRAS